MNSSLPVISVFEKLPSVTALFTTRHGGVSDPPYDSLNLGYHTGDSPEKIDLNWNKLSERFGLDPKQIKRVNQVHSDTLLDASDLDNSSLIEGDALFTSEPGVPIAILTADCVPILLYDPVKSTVAAIHAGWRGSQKQILYKTLQTLKKKGEIKIDSTQIAIGPCISQAFYKVGPEVAREFDPIFTLKKEKELYLDLVAINRDQLQRAGILPQNITTVNHCTYQESENFFSYRKEGPQTGRMAAVIKLA